MSLSTVSAWDDEYARLARMASQLRTTGLSASRHPNVDGLRMDLERLDGALVGWNPRQQNGGKPNSSNSL